MLRAGFNQTTQPRISLVGCPASAAQVARHGPACYQFLVQRRVENRELKLPGELGSLKRIPRGSGFPRRYGVDLRCCRSARLRSSFLPPPKTKTIDQSVALLDCRIATQCRDVSHQRARSARSQCGLPDQRRTRRQRLNSSRRRAEGPH